MAKQTASAEYTNAELLALYREALAYFAKGGKVYRKGDLTIDRGDATQIKAIADELEQTIAAASRGIIRNFARHGRS